jgi:hypothetical protein
MNPALLALASLFLVDASMPEPAALVKEIEAHQHRLDELRENYTFHEITRTDDLDASGAVHGSTTEERDVFYVNGHRVARLLKKNGKELNESENRDEQERVRKLTEKDLKALPGHSWNRRGENVSLSQILPLMRISNPRRATLSGRSCMVFDFIGDRHAKAHGLAENAAKRITGTVWIDETDHEVARLEVRFDDNFHIGAGFLANIQRDTSLVFVQSRIDQDLWMPVATEIHLAARELLVKNIRENISVKDSGFRRFDVEVLQQVAAPPQ